MLSITLPAFCSQEPGNSFGFSNQVEGIIVPKDKKVETVGSRFSDEYELIAYQYLGYIQAQKAQSTELKIEARTGEEKSLSLLFFEKALATLEEHQIAKYQKMVEIAAKRCNKPTLSRKDLAKELLANPELYEYRIDILENVVLAAGAINRFKEQVTLPVQAVLSNRDGGGVTGTLNPYALPNYNPKKKAPDSTREVEAETLLQIAINLEDGTEATVATFAEEKVMDCFDRRLARGDCAAIVNEGGYGMEGLTTLEWAKKLQAGPHGKDRSFLMIIPDADGKRKEHILKADGTVEIFPGKILPPRCVCLFSPEDTRGTDLPIAAGRVHYFPSRTTNLQEMGQSVWRGRGTGGKHISIWHIPESLKMGSGKETLAAQFDAIKRKGLDQQGGMNLKAQLFRISDLATSGIREALFPANPVAAEPNYWAEDQAKARKQEIGLDNLFYSIFRSYFIKDRSIDFEGDYAPAVMINTEDKLEKAYGDEIAKLQAKKIELIAAAAKLAQEHNEEADSLSEEELIKVLTSIMNHYSEVAVDTPKEDKVTIAMVNALNNIEDEAYNTALKAVPAESKDALSKEDLTTMVKKSNRSGRPLKELLTEHLKRNKEKLIPTAVEELKDAAVEKVGGWFGLQKPPVVEEAAERSKEKKEKSAPGWMQKGLYAAGETLYAAAKKIDAAGAWLNLGKPIGVEEKAEQAIQEKMDVSIDEEQEDNLKLLCDCIAGIEEKREQIAANKHKEAIPFIAACGERVVAINGICKKLEEEQKLFIENKEAHKAFIPEKVAQAGSGNSGVKEQVMEQQTQKMQVQVSVDFNKGKKDRAEGDKNKYAKINMQAVEKPEEVKGVFVDRFAGLEDCQLGDIYLTKEMQKLMDRFPSWNGMLPARIAQNDKGQVTLLSKLDYHLVIAPECEGYRSRNGKDPQGNKVSQVTIYQPSSKGLFFVDSTHNNDPIKAFANLAKVRFMLGYSPTNDEKQLIDNWINSLPDPAKSALRKRLREKNNPNVTLVR
jgi:hypothetical protein